MTIRQRLHLTGLASAFLSFILISFVLLVNDHFQAIYKDMTISKDLMYQISMLRYMSIELFNSPSEKSFNKWGDQYNSIQRVLLTKKINDTVGQAHQAKIAQDIKQLRISVNTLYQRHLLSRVSPTNEERKQSIHSFMIASQNVIYTVNLLFNNLSTKAAQAQQQLLIFTIVLLVFQVIGITIISTITVRYIYNTLQSITEGTNQISSGNLEHQIPIKSNDELGTLAKRINQMSSDLLVSYQLVRDEVQQRKRDEANLQEANNLLHLICECYHCLIHASSEQSLIQDVLNKIVAYERFKLAWVGFCESEPDSWIKPAASAGDNSHFLTQTRFACAINEWSHNSVSAAIRNNSPLVIQDLDNDPHRQPWMEEAVKNGFHTAIILPLYSLETNVFGCLFIFGDKANSFASLDTSALSTFVPNLSYRILSLRHTNLS